MGAAPVTLGALSSPGQGQGGRGSWWPFGKGSPSLGPPTAAGASGGTRWPEWGAIPTSKRSLHEGEAIATAQILLMSPTCSFMHGLENHPTPARCRARPPDGGECHSPQGLNADRWHWGSWPCGGQCPPCPSSQREPSTTPGRPLRPNPSPTRGSAARGTRVKSTVSPGQEASGSGPARSLGPPWARTAANKVCAPCYDLEERPCGTPPLHGPRVPPNAAGGRGGLSLTCTCTWPSGGALGSRNSRTTTCRMFQGLGTKGHTQHAALGLQRLLP